MRQQTGWALNGARNVACPPQRYSLYPECVASSLMHNSITFIYYICFTLKSNGVRKRVIYFKHMDIICCFCCCSCCFCCTLNRILD